jgi:hypothetical protein
MVADDVIDIDMSDFTKPKRNVEPSSDEEQSEEEIAPPAKGTVECMCDHGGIG